MKLNGLHASLPATLLTVTAISLTVFTPPLEGPLPSSHDHAPIPGQLPAPDTIVLTGDVDAEAHRLAALVLDAALEHDVSVERADFEVQYVDRIDEDSFLGGETDGRVIVIGRNVAEPDRVLLHELAHAVVGIHHGHGEPWRSVYVTAVCEAFGERRARRELRRIEWMYDKSYLDDLDADDLTTSEEADDHAIPIWLSSGHPPGRYHERGVSPGREPLPTSVAKQIGSCPMSLSAAGCSG
jgi:hypothetical protein